MKKTKTKIKQLGDSHIDLQISLEWPNSFYHHKKGNKTLNVSQQNFILSNNTQIQYIQNVIFSFCIINNILITRAFPQKYANFIKMDLKRILNAISNLLQICKVF